MIFSFRVYTNLTRILNNKCKDFIPPIIKCQSFHSEFTSEEMVKTDNKESRKNELSGINRSKYDVFRDEEAPVILDVEEEKQRWLQQEPDIDIEKDQFAGINLSRGYHGVFDIEDLVEILKKENAENIFICSVPKHLKYVDYMCIVTGRSFRHMTALGEFVRRIYKMKRNPGDQLPRIEGEKSKDWMALDLGNIALHIFSEEARLNYDLESLWSVGPEYDKECNKSKDPLIELFERHSIYLNDLKPK